MPYLPIEKYGLIGDMHTVALVGTNGSIDWMCWPYFDSPSVFAAILDDKVGGRFHIKASGKENTHKQMYWPDTNVLITRFLSPEGVSEVQDFMSIDRKPVWTLPRRLIRIVRSVRGKMTFDVECRPAFNYGRAAHETVIRDGFGCVFNCDDPGHRLKLALTTNAPLQVLPDGGITSRFELKPGESMTFILQEDNGNPPCPTEVDIQTELNDTIEYWHTWLNKCQYKGRWREMVHRSALALKLMTFKPTGAIVAAPTCSLPEGIGGERNWDYRYTWIRDASFTLYGFMRIGFTEEAREFIEWLRKRISEHRPDGSLQIMYSIWGEHKLTEHTLDHLEGYRGSRPCRVGNAAYDQLQLDIYGELMDAVYLYNKYGTPIDYELWCDLRKMLNYVVDLWKLPDEGVWEVRGERQHFIYSKLMCWIALDRGLRLADKRSFPADRERWLKTRDEIYEWIMTKGWSEDRKAFVQHEGSKTLDASILMMPLTFFVSPTDGRMQATIDRIMEELVSDSLVYRYNVEHTDDGLTGDEGTFSLCTFWLVEAMARSGRTREARLLFEKMLSYANHLGLYAEEIGASGESLGNFPQAFTHLALISAAYNLDRTLNG